MAALCAGLPDQFAQYFVYIKQLDFEEKPNYDLLRLLFDQVIEAKARTLPIDYDWNVK